jgi:hypothetical protein
MPVLAREARVTHWSGRPRREHSAGGGGRVSGREMPGLVSARAAGPAGGAGQRVTAGLAVQVGDLGFG